MQNRKADKQRNTCLMCNHATNQPKSARKHGSSMDRRRFLVAEVEIGFGIVAGSLMATTTSIAQAPSHPRKEQISAPSPLNTNQKARIFITGSADGLGHAAAKTLLEDEYQVVVQVRSRARLTAVQDLVDRGAIASIGDLSDFAQTRDLGCASDQRRADRVHGFGRLASENHIRLERSVEPFYPLGGTGLQIESVGDQVPNLVRNENLPRFG